MSAVMTGVGSSATGSVVQDTSYQTKLSEIAKTISTLPGVQSVVVGQAVQTTISVRKNWSLPEFFCFNFQHSQASREDLMELLQKYKAEKGSLHERIYSVLTEKVNERVCNKFVQQLADQPIISKETFGAICRQLVSSLVSYSQQEPVELESCVKVLMEMLRPGVGFASQKVSSVTPADIRLSCADTQLQWHFPAQEHVLDLIQKEQAGQSCVFQHWAPDSLLTKVFYLSNGSPSLLIKSLLSQLAQKIDGLSHHQLQKLLDSVVLAAAGNAEQAYQVKRALISFFMRQRCLFVFDGSTTLGRCFTYEESVV